VRETLKRIYTVVKQRKPDGIVDLHVYDCMHAPAVGFATSYWNGEQLGRGPKVKAEGLPLDRFRTEFMGRNWGTPADVLYYVLGGYRACMAIALLHDVPVRAENLNDLDLCASLWDLREGFGVKEAEWLPYWRNEEYVTCSGENCHVSLWKRSDGGVLAVVSNLGEEPADVEVALDLQELGLANGLTARDALAGETVSVDGGRTVLPIPGQDFRVVRVEPAPRP
jgi:hypothetical protein